MKILIIGASKGIGLATTKAALAAGFDVRAFARSAAAMTLTDPGMEKRPGDATSQQDVEAALEDIDAVILTLGVGLNELIEPVSLFSDATRVLIAAMTAKKVRRLVCVTGFGAGDSQASIGLLQRAPFRLVFGRAYDDKTRQEDLIKQSGLDWTIARPGVLFNGLKTGRYRVLREPSSWRNGIISRENVADFLVKQVKDRTYLHAAPVLVI